MNILINPYRARTELNQFKHSKHHGCSFPGSLRRRDITTHDIDYVE